MEMAGKTLMVHENFRFQAPRKRALELFEADAIGDAVWGRFSYWTGFDVYVLQPYLAELESFALFDVGVHPLAKQRISV